MQTNASGPSGTYWQMAKAQYCTAILYWTRSKHDCNASSLIYQQPKYKCL